jgi:aminopeptidase YwaD
MCRVKRYLLVCVLLSSTACAARSSGPAATPGESPSRPGAAAAADVISEASVRAHMEFLASDALNGRGSGTRDEWIAVTYVAAQLRRWGLEPLGDAGGYVQTIEMKRPELAGPPVLAIGGRKFTHGSAVTVGPMSAAAISGKLVRHVKGQAPERGAVAFVPDLTPELQAELAPAALVLTRTGGCGPARGAAAAFPRITPSTVGVTPAAARPTCVALGPEALAAAEAAPAGTAVSLEGPVKVIVTTNTWNAVGRLPGSDPTLKEDVILLSAHIDHVGTGRGQTPPGGDTIYNGADDDASGSIAVL